MGDGGRESGVNISGMTFLSDEMKQRNIKGKHFRFCILQAKST